MQRITKAQLSELAKHKGEVDTDTGQVFKTFVGDFDVSTREIVGGPVYEDKREGVQYGEFSLSSITASKPPQVTAKKRKPSATTTATPEDGGTEE